MIKQVSMYVPAHPDNEGSANNLKPIPGEPPAVKLSKKPRIEILMAREQYKRSLCAQAQAQRDMLSEIIVCDRRITDHDPLLF